MSLHRDCLHIVVKMPLPDEFLPVLAEIRRLAERIGLQLREENLSDNPGCGPYDIVLLATERLDYDLEEWLRRQRRNLRDQPLVTLSRDRAPGVLTDASLVFDNLQNPQGVEFSLLADLMQSWRQHMRLRRHLHSMESQLQSLLDIQTEPVALIRYPHHTHANLAYRRLWQLPEELPLEDLDLAEVFSPSAMTALHQRLPTWAKGEHLDIILGGDSHLQNLQIRMQCLAPAPENIFQVRLINNQPQHLNDNPELLLQAASHDRRALIEHMQHIQHRGEHQASDRQWVLMATRMERWDLVDEHGEPTPQANELIAQLEQHFSDQDLPYAFACIDIHHLGIVAPLKTDAHVLASAGKLQNLITPHLPEIAYSLSNGFCAGLVQIHGALPDAETLVHQALHACAQAQRQGQSLLVYSPQRAGATSGQPAAASVRQQLRKAMDHNQFTLFYQPILNLFSPGEPSYEVLLRMSDDQGQWITPVELFNQSEQTGQALLIDQWVIQHLANTLRKTEQRTRVFLNLSAQAIHDPAFFVWLEEALGEVHRHHELVMQISEVDAWMAGRQAQSFQQQVQHLGLKTCLKHLGMTTHAQQLAEHFDCEYYKLHGPLIRNIHQPDTQARLYRLIAPLAPKQKAIVGPMVENASCLSLLWQAGIKYIQGHYLQPPHQHMDYNFSAEE
ncbi:EAL domain-containing protein [Balneatrix alpica]|uniref:EAL domain-containing protein n=1 Tax=Balneatrix alpica TaxID=75684 RepID=A0ABV5ZB67_9GAMM|nr:EAL domain-containing protein [Balneatrix alpica]